LLVELGGEAIEPAVLFAMCPDETVGGLPGRQILYNGFTRSR
jgi:hypothetical protein